MQGHGVERRSPQFVVWDHHQPSLLPDVDAVARFGQARGLVVVSAWVLDDVGEACRPVVFQRLDVEGPWTLIEDDGRQALVPADPSDDPRVLAVMEVISRRTWRLARIDPEDWLFDDERDPERPQMYAPFGFLPPIEGRRGVGGWVVLFSPEVIAEQSRWLTLDDFDAYLAGIDMRLSWHVMYRALKADERAKVIDDRLCEVGLSALTTEVQMRVMDRQR